MRFLPSRQPIRDLSPRPSGYPDKAEGGNRRVTRWPADGTFASSDVLMDRFDGKRLSRPNDVVCKSDASVYFTNPGLRIPLGERELDPSAVYRIMPDGSNKHVADFEYPNGLAFSPDERVLYVANTRHAAYIHRIELDSAGNMVRRSIFADMSSDEKIGVPDGMKVDVQGNVYCTGPGGTWGYAADGTHIGTIKTPEVPANLAFGGPDMKTLFFTAHTSVYSMRVKVAGLPGHPFKSPDFRFPRAQDPPARQRPGGRRQADPEKPWLRHAPCAARERLFRGLQPAQRQ